jgi:hypothetical protein
MIENARQVAAERALTDWRRAALQRTLFGWGEADLVTGKAEGTTDYGPFQRIAENGRSGDRRSKQSLNG